MTNKNNIYIFLDDKHVLEIKPTFKDMSKTDEEVIPFIMCNLNSAGVGISSVLNTLELDLDVKLEIIKRVFTNENLFHFYIDIFKIKSIEMQVMDMDKLINNKDNEGEVS